jgi:hypothetical protein
LEPQPARSLLRLPVQELPPVRELLPVPLPVRQELLPVQHLRLRLLLRLLHMLFH